jgi:putative transposase
MDLIGELFDPKAELFIVERMRPHWSQVGAIVFLTFRTYDSIPKPVLLLWERQKNEWMRRRGHHGHWADILPTLEPHEKANFNEEFSRCREIYLDECHGRCVLRDSDCRQIVADSLLHFDRIRYRMGDFVVMPNHVHLLVAFSDSVTMLQQCESWMRYSASRVNRLIGERGKFWQPEAFDHLVRSVDQYEYLRKYIADNPSKAKLSSDSYLHRVYG